MNENNKNLNLVGQINASGGGGGGGGAYGGRGGNGGSVNITQEIPPNEVTIHNVKNPHKEYWQMILKDIKVYIKNHILGTVIAGLILAGLIYLLGWN